MKFISLKITSFFLFCLCFYNSNAQEMRSGLLLINTQKANKTRFIPLDKKVKIWAGEDNKLYRAKILAVDTTFVYLSTGQRLPFRSINSIKRKRIMFRDVGNATVATGVAAELAFADAVWNQPYRENRIHPSLNYDDDDDLDLGEQILLIAGGAVVITVVAVGVGIVVATVGVLVSIFEPRYYVGEWELVPYNPSKDVFFVHD